MPGMVSLNMLGEIALVAKPLKARIEQATEWLLSYKK